MNYRIFSLQRKFTIFDLSKNRIMVFVLGLSYKSNGINLLIFTLKTDQTQQDKNREEDVHHA